MIIELFKKNNCREEVSRKEKGDNIFQNLSSYRLTGKYYWQVLSKEQKDERSVATEDDSSTTAGIKKNILYLDVILTKYKKNVPSNRDIYTNQLFDQ